MVGPLTCCNFFPLDKDELTRKAPIKSNDTSILISIVFHALNPALTQAFTLTLAFLGRYRNKDVQKAIKLASKLFIRSLEHG